MSNISAFPEPKPAPLPGTFHLQFQKELPWTEQAQFIGQQLAHTHFLYEGWPQLAGPLSGILLKLYTDIACLAIRECSEPDRKVAQNRALAYGVMAFEELEQALASCDTTALERRHLIEEYLARVMSVRRYALVHGPGILSDREDGQIQRTLDESEDAAGF